MNARNAVMLPHIFVLDKPKATIKVRRETAGGDEGALLRRGGVEFINTSSSNEFYLASPNIGPRHADIYWDGRDNTIRITPVTFDGDSIWRTVVDTTILVAGDHKILEVGSNLEFGAGNPDDPFACWAVADIQFGAPKKTRAAGYEHCMSWAMGRFLLFCVCNLLGIALYLASKRVFGSIGRF
ncbi:hypothetical protein IWZ01DRAFT_546142 [Phyllosticta capitalensis]